MSIKTAFMCAGIVENTEDKQKHIVLCAISSGIDSEKNKSFSNNTPFAEFNLIIDEETDADKLFKEGEVYYVTISK